MTKGPTRAIVARLLRRKRAKARSTARNLDCKFLQVGGSPHSSNRASSPSSSSSVNNNVPRPSGGKQSQGNRQLAAAHALPPPSLASPVESIPSLADSDSDFHGPYRPVNWRNFRNDLGPIRLRQPREVKINLFPHVQPGTTRHNQTSGRTAFVKVSARRRLDDLDVVIPPSP